MKKKVLFIDRDGTLIVEPLPDRQVDSLEKLEFYPGVFQYLSKIAQEMDYELVIVTNQDGLGTESFPEANFWLPHNKMLKAFENEGIHFASVHIDRTFEHENAPTRKPGTGMLTSYFSQEYDLANSFVIGDRLTDVQLAKNLGAKAILLNTMECPDAVLVTTSWREIYYFLRAVQRSAQVRRTTQETDVFVEIALEGTGKTNINTGIGFFDHLLSQIPRHGLVDLTIQAKGDLHIDEHHTIEDVAITLGQAINKALGNKKGIERYGFTLPMDDCIASVSIDFGGRAELVWKAKFKREKIGDMPTEMFNHFFKSFCLHAQCNLYVKAKGKNEHHKIESIFKAFAKALSKAIQINEHQSLPSTKGAL
ncbi:MAG: bifunctional histidinol-phosphatase/imidazoleglycerol-phosphate dehydratase HisB [Bacteroidia bacterium]|nr:bifunctional histidinol-phosphatase/imidazoleglycerol-phosphate dehydratase HisB [Bacteroidia bacterium]